MAGHQILPNIDSSPSKTVLLDAGFADLPIVSVELYDLMLDPAETNSLAGLSAHDSVSAYMRGRLERWMKNTGDIIQNSEFVDVPGAVVNPRDGLDAGSDRLQIL